jgi:hypothetical protein
VATNILDLTSIVDFVVSLVVNENPGVSLATEESIEDGLELGVSKYLECIIIRDLEDVSND